MTCALVIVGSIGLMGFAYFNPMTATSDTATATRAEYAAVVSGEPLIRSDYDVYLSENTLTYVKERAPAPTRRRCSFSTCTG